MVSPFPTRLTMWNLSDMLLVVQTCITLTFLSDSNLSKSISSEIFREMNTTICMVLSGKY
jgi:hypothetical protein